LATVIVWELFTDEIGMFIPYTCRYLFINAGAHDCR